MVTLTQQLKLEDILSNVNAIQSNNPMPMEMLNIGKNFGQRFGFIHYRTTIPIVKTVHMIDGVMDRAIIMLDNKTVALQEINAKDKKPTFTFVSSQFDPHVKEHELDILVENTGRVNIGGGMNVARKGLLGKVLTDEKVHENWTIYPLDFNEKFINQLNKSTHWKAVEHTTAFTPTMFRGVLHVNGTPQDTFINMSKWNKGVVFVNGFNLGRYWNRGPQKTLYVPAPMLRTGDNQLMIFELHSSSQSVEFVDKPILNSNF